MDLKEKLVGIVGEKNFLDKPQDLISYTRDFSLIQGCRPACVVRPRSREQVQGVIRLANEVRTPIIPSSSRVHFHGSTVPKLGGIVMDLKEMNRVLDVDELNRKVRIEPGVTWGQIQEELEKIDSRMMIPLLPHPGRSVLSSWLEREVPVIPAYEYGEPLGGTELVWPNGDVFRTGSASAPGYPESASKGADFAGPGLNFIQLIKGAQGTFGVVTWANVKFEYLPKKQKTFFLPFEEAERAVKPLYRIQRLKIGHECFLVSGLNLALILAEGRREELDRLRRNLPPWILVLVLSGLRRLPEGKIEYEERALKKMRNEEFPQLTILDALPGVPGAGSRLQTLLKKPWPDEAKYWKHIYRGGCEDFLFIAKLASVPRLLDIVEDVTMKNGFAKENVGCYFQPIEYARACHVEFNFYYEPDNSGEIQKVRRVKIEAARKLLEEGAFFSRPYGELAALVYDKAASYTSVLKRIKEIFDPHGIMNPGNLCF
jgi:FAD/FMN-containing dehydrogenase